MFVTLPIGCGAGIRCCLRDRDGCLIGAGQFAGLLYGRLAVKRPGDLPG